ncbi:SH3 domain-containing protein [Campylobacter geochelonis]|uniref:Putative periplasmic protein n=1 Tax=Campylobacter geochelonis TaxID=1780362 RepID=A0A128EHS1_9BACT|nr:SH3 domain-containing protein [Campylobacter geochelonis]QKF71263.1 putative membrane protein [Campylobacter geochelonis]CZE48151.1 putative periplasmic protein [Campylobacter geochelonis]CZE49038.1 putative periplasmic protein [Campylobacter geochelonis]CZE51118.1 putative periplasmic protein [Campylobacter geochelonis]
MLRAVFLTIFLAVFAIAAQDDVDYLKSVKPTAAKDVKPKAYTEDEILNKQHLTIDDLKLIAPTDEGNLDLDESKIYQEVRVTDLLLAASKIPKSVYVNQVFGMDLSANIQQNISLDLNLSMEKTSGLVWLNSNNLSWSQDEKGVYRTRLWFEANSTNAELKNIQIVAKRNGEFFQKASIKPKLPTFKPIQEKANYAHVVADELVVKSYKTAKFDDNTNIMTIALSAKGANLSSFHLSQDVVKQGINSIKGSYSNQSAFYFVVIENNQTSFSFSYFNAKTAQFENFSLNVKLEIDDLSTQTELNPQDDPFLIYKKLAVFIGAIFFLALYVLSKNTTPLIFAVLIISYNIYTQDPHSTGVVNANTKVKILPIEKSTIFYHTKDAEKVNIFDKNNEYYKVLFKNGKIGWVNQKDLSIDN